jgi:hypothetical protein
MRRVTVKLNMRAIHCWFCSACEDLHILVQFGISKGRVYAIVTPNCISATGMQSNSVARQLNRWQVS